MPRVTWVALGRAVATSVLLASGWWVPAGLSAQRPARDRAAQTPAGTGVIAGFVVAADTGRPIKRARVLVNGAETTERAGAAQGAGQLGAMVRDRVQQMAQSGIAPEQLLAGLRLVQSAQTDDQGRYEIKGLPAGRYTVSASKTGFVTVNHGQRRPLRPGTPLDLREGQQLRNVSLTLPRGSVVTGHVLDEDSEPLARAAVTVLRYQYQGGERRLVPAGSDQTDDRGEFRVYGLPPGEYYVSAVLRLLNRPIERLLQAVGGQATPAAAQEEDVTLGYAPTYYPGVITAAEATRVSVALAQELGGVDFQLQLVPMARLSGHVYNADATPLAGGAVVLVPDESGAAARGANITGRVRNDGAFTVEDVPPGRYTLYARNRPARDLPPDVAVQAVTVTGEDLSGLAVTLSPGATLSGSITFESASTTPPGDLTRFRITAPALDPIPFGVNQPSRVTADGTFSVTGVPAGRRAIRAPNPPQPWALKAVIVDGRDVTDTPLDVRPGQKLTQVQVIFTDRVTEISGTVRDEKGGAASGYTVIAFSTDAATWRAQSRTIQATQPDQAGAFRIRGLPPGSYFLAAVDDVEPGEWFDPAFLEETQKGAARITLHEGDTMAQDVKVKTGS